MLNYAYFMGRVKKSLGNVVFFRGIQNFKILTLTYMKPAQVCILLHGFYNFFKFMTLCTNFSSQYINITIF